MMIDTMANGTLIHYEIDQSDSKTVHIEVDKVTSLFSDLEYEGQLATDTFCV